MAIHEKEGAKVAIFVVLLRGINVGKHRQIPMAELSEYLSEAGFSAIKTYIRSGNIIVRSDEANSLKVSQLITQVIKAKYGFEIPVVVYTKDEYERFHQEMADLCQTIIGDQQLVYGYAQDLIGTSESNTFSMEEEEVLVRGRVLVMRIGPRLSDSPLMKELTKNKSLQQRITVRNQQTSNKLLALLKAY